MEVLQEVLGERLRRDGNRSIGAFDVVATISTLSPFVYAKEVVGFYQPCVMVRRQYPPSDGPRLKFDSSGGARAPKDV